MTVTKEQIDQVNRYHQGWGMWNEEDIEISIISSTYACISYKQRVVNAYEHQKFVWLNLVERLQGKTLEEKIRRAVEKIKKKLKRKNAEILACRQMEIQLKEQIR